MKNCIRSLLIGGVQRIFIITNGYKNESTTVIELFKKIRRTTAILPNSLTTCKGDVTLTRKITITNSRKPGRRAAGAPIRAPIPKERRAIPNARSRNLNALTTED